MQRHLLGSLIFALVAATLAACGPNPAGRPPVSSPVYQFQAPDAEDFAEDTDDDAADADADTDAGDEE